MIYLYDNCICEDLMRSFNPNNVPNPVVKVVDPEGITQLAAQIQQDEIKFPIVALSRDGGADIDTDRYNFVQAHKGVQSVMDVDTNNLYYERAIPIKLSYELTVLTTNTADMDEIIKELIFKYTSMYFLTLRLPYECKRQVRFGVVIDDSRSFERKSGYFEYIDGGQLYQTILPLRCEGCVLVSYSKAKLTNVTTDIAVTDK